jgi:hypothetical protein
VTRKKAFDSVRMMREIRDRISRDIQGMALEEEKEYLARLIAGSRRPGAPLTTAAARATGRRKKRH